MIFQWMQIFRSELPYRIARCGLWIDVKVFFPFYCFIFQKKQIFVSPQLHSWERQTYASTEFFVGTIILRNFCLKYFSIQSIFFAACSPKVNFFILVHYNVSKTQIFGAPSSTPGVDRDMHPCVSFRKFNNARLLFKAFFDIICIYKFYHVFKIILISYILMQYPARSFKLSVLLSATCSAACFENQLHIYQVRSLDRS